MTQYRPTRRHFIGAASIAALAVGAGCNTSGSEQPTQSTVNDPEPTDDPPETDTQTQAATTDSPEGAESSTIEMHTDNEGVYFDPKGLHVEPGTTVTFLNVTGSHSSTAYHPSTDNNPRRIPADADPWDSELYTEPDQTLEVTLDVEGVYDYYCRPHESMGMVGRIVVGEPQDGPATTPPDDLPPGARDAFPPIEKIIADGTIAGP